MTQLVAARPGRAVFYQQLLGKSALPRRYFGGSSLHEEDLVALEKTVAGALVMRAMSLASTGVYSPPIIAPFVLRLGP
jgi:hypothetical protein